MELQPVIVAESLSLRRLHRAEEEFSLQLFTAAQLMEVERFIIFNLKLNWVSWKISRVSSLHSVCSLAVAGARTRES